MSPPIRVVLVEDHVILRALLRSGLAARSDVTVVGEAGTGAEAVQLATTLQPDVLVLDIDLPGDLDSLDVVAQLAGGAIRVLAHSAHDDPVLVGHLLLAGAGGYLAKDQPVEQLGDAIVAVAMGQGRWFGREPKAPVVPTQAEAAVLAHLAEGGRPATLATTLKMDPADVRRHLAGLCSRLGAVSWLEALARAWGAGLVGGPHSGASYSMRVNVPGHASSARLISYGA